MKKAFGLIMTTVLMLVIAACVEVDLSEVVSIELIGWVPEERYEKDEEIDLSGARVLVSFEGDKEDEELSLTAEDVTLTGTGSLNVDNELDTTTVGDFRIKISYGGLSVTVEYSIVEHLVRPGDDIQAKVDAADEGDTVYFAPGTYDYSDYTTTAAVIVVDQAINLIGSIDASGGASTTIKGNPDTELRAMNIMTFNGNVTIKDIVFTDFGKNNSGGNRVFSIFTDYDGTVLYDNVTVKDFSKVAIVASDGIVTFQNSTIDGARATGSNSAPTGIQVQYDGVLHIIDSLFKNTVSTTDEWNAVAVNILNGGTLGELRGTVFEGNEENVYLGNEFDWTNYNYPVWGEIDENVIISGNTHDGNSLVFASTFVQDSGYPGTLEDALMKHDNYQEYLGDDVRFEAAILDQRTNGTSTINGIYVLENTVMIIKKNDTHVFNISASGSLTLEAGASLEVWYYDSENFVIEGSFVYVAYYLDSYGDPIFVGSIDDVPDGVTYFDYEDGLPA